MLLHSSMRWEDWVGEVMYNLILFVAFCVMIAQGYAQTQWTALEDPSKVANCLLAYGLGMGLIIWMSFRMEYDDPLKMLRSLRVRPERVIYEVIVLATLILGFGAVILMTQGEIFRTDPLEQSITLLAFLALFITLYMRYVWEKWVKGCGSPATE